MCVGLERARQSPFDIFDRITLTREALAGLRLRALRRGVWFQKLKVGERRLMNLVIKIVDSVRSRILAKLLSCIVDKLLEAMEVEVCRLMKTVGRDLAKRLSQIAQDWGNRSAAAWARNYGFVRFLAVLRLNEPDSFCEA